MKSEFRVVIADDHPIFRAGLKQTIESGASLKVVFDAADGEAALRAAIEFEPDVIVLDVNMPKMTGLEVAAEIKRKGLAAVGVVFLTMHDDRAMFEKALDLGVKGYVLKDSATTDIVNCLNAVVAGQNFVSPAMTTYLFNRASRRAGAGGDGGTLADLSENERRILKMIAEYKTSREIGDELCLSYRTIENYRTNICAKLNLRGAHSLIKFALQNQDEL